jgi:predicted membrane metal-binding protein
MFNGMSDSGIPNEWVARVILDTALKGWVFLLGLWVILRLGLRSASASVRYLICVVVAGGILLLPAISVLSPNWNVPLQFMTTNVLQGEIKEFVNVSNSSFLLDRNGLSHDSGTRQALPTPREPLEELSRVDLRNRRKMGEEAIAPFSSAFPKQESSQKTIASEVGMDREPNAVSPVNGGQPAATRILWISEG